MHRTHTHTHNTAKLSLSEENAHRHVSWLSGPCNQQLNPVLNKIYIKLHDFVIPEGLAASRHGQSLLRGRQVIAGDFPLITTFHPDTQQLHSFDAHTHTHRRTQKPTHVRTHAHARTQAGNHDKMRKKPFSDRSAMFSSTAKLINGLTRWLRRTEKKKSQHAHFLPQNQLHRHTLLLDQISEFPFNAKIRFVFFFLNDDDDYFFNVFVHFTWCTS